MNAIIEDYHSAPRQMEPTDGDGPDLPDLPPWIRQCTYSCQKLIIRSPPVPVRCDNSVVNLRGRGGGGGAEIPYIGCIGIREIPAVHAFAHPRRKTQFGVPIIILN